ncbi:hypothetical protein [Kribbella sp. NBC_00359]|jgi:hypothetical protein
MSEWYGLRPAGVSEKTAPRRPEAPAAPEPEVEVPPPSEEPVAEE